MSNDKKSQNNSNPIETRTIDREYYANSETARNKWFNYSDPYYLENNQVKKYQENIEENEEKIKSKQTQTTNNFNNNQMGSTTDYTHFAQQNQYSQNGINPFENTTPPEPIVDIESHINLNTAPTYAGDHLYPSGYTYTEEFSDTHHFDENLNNSYDNEEYNADYYDKNTKFYNQQQEDYSNKQNEGDIV